MSLEQEVFQVIARSLKISEDTCARDTLIEEVCESSLDQVCLLFDLEERFDIDIEMDFQDEAKSLKTLGDIVKGVEALVALKKETVVES